jgi:hypothetical protein
MIMDIQTRNFSSENPEDILSSTRRKRRDQSSASSIHHLKHLSDEALFLLNPRRMNTIPISPLKKQNITLNRQSTECVRAGSGVHIPGPQDS